MLGIKKELKNVISCALFELYSYKYNDEIEIEKPKNINFGDFSSNIAMKLAKILKKSPMEIAKDINLIIKSDFIKKTEIINPGFLNFYINEENLLNNLLQLNVDEKINIGKKESIMIDFGSPNVAKPLHLGNFRGLIIGDSLSRILDYCGQDVLKDNFLGDWGTQFGKLILAFKKWGNKNQIVSNPTKELVNLYSKFHNESEKNPNLSKEAAEEFRKLEQDKNDENKKIWSWIIDISKEEFNSFLKCIKVQYDVTRGEHFYEYLITDVLKIIKDKNIAKKGDGNSLVVFFDDNTPNMIIKKSDGATLYQTRDLAKILFYNMVEKKDKLIYVVGADQKLHFDQIFKISKLIGFESKNIHVSHGMLRLPEGKMSTRRGVSVSLNEAIEKSISIAKSKIKNINDFTADEIEEISKQVGIGALKFSSVSQNTNSDIEFSWDKILDFNGFSSVFIQYTAVRCVSVLKKSDFIDLDKIKLDRDLIEYELIKKILDFKDVVLYSKNLLKTHYLAHYLFELSSEYNSFYSNNKILKSNNESLRLLITKKVFEVLKKGMFLLGIEIPKKL